MIVLPNINVLVAIAWPSHVHHSIAIEWFDRTADDGWATCPMTEFGFVRMCLNPAVVGRATTATSAITMMSALRAVGQHSFWSDDSEVSELSNVSNQIQGHRQMPDAQLALIAERRGGRIAMLDGGCSQESERRQSSLDDGGRAIHPCTWVRPDADAAVSLRADPAHGPSSEAERRLTMGELRRGGETCARSLSKRNSAIADELAPVAELRGVRDFIPELDRHDRRIWVASARRGVRGPFGLLRYRQVVEGVARHRPDPVRLTRRGGCCGLRNALASKRWMSIHSPKGSNPQTPRRHYGVMPGEAGHRPGETFS
jgi:uncharacterized protein